MLTQEYVLEFAEESTGKMYSVRVYFAPDGTEYPMPTAILRAGGFGGRRRRSVHVVADTSNYRNHELDADPFSIRSRDARARASLRKIRSSTSGILATESPK